MSETGELLAFVHGGEWRPTSVSRWWACADGRIASVYKTRVPRILRGTTCGKYRALMLTKPLRHFYIHALVCEAFHGPRPTGLEVRHLDGDRHNNAASNLAWGTRSENHSDKHHHGTAATGERNPMAKLTEDTVAQMRRMRRECGSPYWLLGEVFGVSKMTAFRAVKGQSWK